MGDIALLELKVHLPVEKVDFHGLDEKHAKTIGKHSEISLCKKIIDFLKFHKNPEISGFGDFLRFLGLPAVTLCYFAISEITFYSPRS